ncbi:MAG TPA: pyridoxamine 5'-phosphate oxidase [Micromonosporaceae bacterium]|nr:pyridoxamine 5'-phosphate oxidase [Micromonosporaceae bacterium]
MRREYARAGLAIADLAPTWLEQLRRWMRDATESGLPEPNAMIVATVGSGGQPSARTVLLKGLDERGLVFFTNYSSRKAVEAAENPRVAAVLPWHAIGRQVIVEGRVERVDRSETESYFATRPRDSQLSAWASPQSQVIAGREVLDAALAEVERRFGPDKPIPAPPNWGGLRIVPSSVEFWQGRPGRLHDRLRYRQADAGWVVERLAP